MKAIKLLFALISFTSLSISANMEALDFSQDTFCPESPKAQLRGGLFYLPNNTEPYSGEVLCTYLINGQNSVKGKIKNGLMVGEWLEWDVNGQIISKQNFLNGSLNGPFKHWAKSGNLQVKGFYKDNSLHGFLVFSDSGLIYRVEMWNHGVEMKHWFFNYSNERTDSLDGLFITRFFEEIKDLSLEGKTFEAFQKDISYNLSLVKQLEFRSETDFVLLAENQLEIEARIIEELMLEEKALKESEQRLAEQKKAADDARQKALLDNKLASILEEEMAYQQSLRHTEIVTALAYIRDEISKNWKRPSDARNGMYVEVMIRLMPNGEVISVEVMSKDASDAMVASVKNALRKVGRFNKLSDLDPDVFDANFRKFRIMFRPEDLNNY
jgi:hypothetical protein